MVVLAWFYYERRVTFSTPIIKLHIINMPQAHYVNIIFGAL
jgi:hypothetical protein